MPNIGELLKAEIRRLSRKEMRTSYPTLKQDLAALKRIASRLEKRLNVIEKLVKEHNKTVQQQQMIDLEPTENEVKSSRISPGLIKKLRKRLKLTRKEFGKLVGVSGNTIYLWETGKVSPRPGAKAAIIRLRKIGVRQAKELLE